MYVMYVIVMFWIGVIFLGGDDESSDLERDTNFRFCFSISVCRQFPTILSPVAFRNGTLREADVKVGGGERSSEN